MSEEDPPRCSVMGYFRHPHYPGTAVHELCGYTWHDHGWIDAYDVTVCPATTGPFPGRATIMKALTAGAVVVHGCHVTEGESDVD